MVLFIIMGAYLFGTFLALFRVPATLAALIIGSSLPKMGILIIIYLFYIILGCFVDGVSMLVMTVPTILPIIIALGFNPVWFGVILVVLVETAVLTPPMGIVLFIIASISGEKVEEVVIAAAPFLGILMIALALLTAFPHIILWLPSLIIKKPS